jgi:hypothetical protein
VGVDAIDGTYGGEKVDGESGTYDVRLESSISYSEESSSGGAAPVGVEESHRVKWDPGMRGEDVDATCVSASGVYSGGSVTGGEELGAG